MVRLAARIDANQNEIVDALRKAGWSVQSLASIGKGVPDLLIAKGFMNDLHGLRGRTLCIEVKDGSKPPSARRLTPDEATWIHYWNGEVRVVKSLDDITDLLHC